MKLHEIQISLIYHLAQYETLDYLSCLQFLDIDETGDRTALSYIFRPLTKNGYLRKHKDGHVTIFAKGRELFPEITPLVALGGGENGIKRVNAISRTAMILGAEGIQSVSTPNGNPCFVPSPCWRKIRKGISGTARFMGILFIHTHRLAVYDIGDGKVDWQLRAERSLFYDTYRDTEATGMLFICDDDKRIEVARQIIRTTMWHRKQLIGKSSVRKRDGPIAYAKSPIRLTTQFRHVYLTTPSLLKQSIRGIWKEEEDIARLRKGSTECDGGTGGDYEEWPFRYFVNIMTDLLKYVCFFATAKSLLTIRGLQPELMYGLIMRKRDIPFAQMYLDELKGVVRYYEYLPDDDAESTGE